jgi:hypothetical protein
MPLAPNECPHYADGSDTRDDSYHDQEHVNDLGHGGQGRPGEFHRERGAWLPACVVTARRKPGD